MSRNIKCCKCNTNMGEIRDARLRKDIVFMCQPCNQLMIKKINEVKRTGTDNPFSGLFDDILKKR